ncbi:hypothetical protein [Methylobacterium sp. GC_Met_2]|uniref:hypothetical protein n=1 Tax=Methylobacterium sp. GC_Met_2 TaxID=2937376 RepID=UPI00226B4C4F|nr:hypothetical protein [Methylobacterium sp. GC_Met_2]
MLKLFGRDDGQAADWPLIAETLLKEAFSALDMAAAEPKTAALALSITRRVHEGAYARITASPGDPFKEPPEPTPTASSVAYDGPQHHWADAPEASAKPGADEFQR